MRIGIDIDGVLTNDDDYILACGTKFLFKNQLNYDMKPYEYETRKFPWNYDDLLLEKYRTEYFWNYVKEEPPRKFAQEVIAKLKKEGHQIYIITSRHLSTHLGKQGENMRTMIQNWLQKNHILYDGLYFSKDKLIEIQNLQLDIMIEDSPKMIPIYSSVVPIFCYDCRYNRDLKCDNMTRVFSWYDIYHKIQLQLQNNKNS
ncbi:MAG: hypothetical protein KH135_03690 [Firmicutes bacterium]|nr:hypothetical protein [Bacillota bacterium]